MIRNTFHKEAIRPQLIKQLTAATSSIHLVIGWIGDAGLIGLLEKKALEGIAVKVVLIKEKEGGLPTIFKSATNNKIKIILLDEHYKEQIIDHRFGILDDAVVLTGNFGWGGKNAPLEAALTITENLPTLATGFEAEFDYLSILNDLEEDAKPANPILPLLKKLEVIKTLLRMEDTDYLDLRLQELESYRTDQHIAHIYRLLQQKLYSDAIVQIKEFVQHHQYLQECIEPPIETIRREIQQLEIDITTISNEYNETQKTLQKFSTAHTESLGDILQAILLQSKIKSEKEAKENEDKQAAFEEAKKDYEDYTKSHEAAKLQQPKTLTPQEQKELRKLYRRTSLKCHPDRVVEELQAEAEEIFVELNQAYKQNDLEKIRAISEQLKAGIMLAKSEGVTTLKKLESTYKSLLQKLENWQEKLDQLQQQPTYQTISRIDNWETYFEETKVTLQEQLDRLIAFNQSEEQETSTSDTVPKLT